MLYLIYTFLFVPLKFKSQINYAAINFCEKSNANDYILIKKRSTKIKIVEMVRENTNLNFAQDILARRYIGVFLWDLLFFNSHPKYGIYSVNNSTTLYDLFNSIASGRTAKVKITILPGVTLFDIMKSMNTSGIFNTTITFETIRNKMPELKNIYDLEGRLFVDTYCVEYQSDPNNLIVKSYEIFDLTLKKILASHKLPNQIKSVNDLLTLSSIVEKETSVEFERPLVAAVYLNRLKKFMKLQADPTVIYGLGDAYNGNITKQHLKTYTPYNTYVIRGLPPNPISTIQTSSIIAVLNPAKVDYLFFVAKSTEGKSHNFSTTYEQHKKYVIQYLKN